MHDIGNKGQMIAVLAITLGWTGSGNGDGNPPSASTKTSSVAITERTTQAAAPMVGPQTAFLQTWTTISPDNQQNWFATMHRRVGELARRPGFVFMSAHRSDDGRRIVAHAPWRNEAELLSAVGSPQAKVGHHELVKWGTPDNGAVYQVADLHGPSGGGEPHESMKPPADDLVAETQRRWAQRNFGTRFVHVNGVSLHIAEGGRGEPVFLLHGYPQSGESWRYIAPELAKTHRVIIPDLRGMGLSEAAKSGYDLQSLAEDMHQLARSMGVVRIDVVGHDWGAAVGAVYAMRYRNEVKRLAFLESALAGAGFEKLWTFSKPNDVFTFIPFLLMGESDAAGDTTGALIQGRESIYLHHLWASFTGDKAAAPFSGWAPYVAAMSRPGVAVSSSSYYRSVYQSAQQVQKLIAQRLEIPVLAIAGEKGIGKNHEALVRSFAANLRGNLILPGAGHFLAEERPVEVSAALQKFLAD